MNSSDPYQQAKDIALRRLNRCESSSADIRKRLIQKGISQEITEQVVMDLIQASLLDDERYARMLVRHQVGRSKGPSVIRQKLAEKGIRLDLNTIKEIAAEVSGNDEIATAKALLERKYPRAWTDPKERQRAFQALLRRGFSFSIVQDVLKKENAIESEDSDEF